MSQLIAHLIGDYVLQNHWMANNKTKAWLPAILHVLLYGIPFLVLGANFWQWLIIVSTHLIIDHYRLAQYWVDFWGTGKPGWLSKQFGSPTPDAPPFLSVWLLIIVDNTMHLTINYLVLLT